MTPRSTDMLLLATAATMLFQTTTKADLSDYQWKNRLLLVATTPDRAKEIAAALRHERSGLIDRDLIVIDLSLHDKRLPNAIRPSAPELEAIRRRYRLSSEPRNEFVLIGKDGGVKARQADALDLQRLFALIDTMPMRKEEMRAKR